VYYYEGIYREVFLVLDGIHLFISFELAVLFFTRGLKKKTGLKVNFGWGLVYSCFALVTFMNITLFFYLTKELWDANIKIFSLIGVIPGLTVLGIMESIYQKYHNSRYFFTLQSITISIITFFTNESITSVLANISLFILGLFMISFFATLIKQSSGAIRKKIITFTLSFYIFIIGDMILSPRVIDIQIQAGVDLIIPGFFARALKISALFLMAAVLFEQPIFYELDWQNKLVQLTVIHKKNGTPIFHKKFQEIKSTEEDQTDISEVFIAGGMTGVSAVLKAISYSSKELKIIDHGDQKIMLEHGEHVYIALIVLEELRIFWDKIKNLRITIETYFEEFLKDYKGKLEYFKPLEGIVRKGFT
jgi:hypothetical protein